MTCWRSAFPTTATFAEVFLSRPLRLLAALLPAGQEILMQTVATEVGSITPGLTQPRCLCQVPDIRAPLEFDFLIEITSAVGYASIPVRVLRLREFIEDLCACVHTAHILKPHKFSGTDCREPLSNGTYKALPSAGKIFVGQTSCLKLVLGSAMRSPFLEIFSGT